VDTPRNSTKEIEERIRVAPNPYAALGELASELTRQVANGGDAKKLSEHFLRIVDKYALEEAPHRHLRYARRLIAANVMLFEDVCKVFALLEELEAMKKLGLAAPTIEEAQLVAEFSSWSRGSSKVRQFADSLQDNWPKDLWFFKDLNP
jgi:hypothetical protein